MSYDVSDWAWTVRIPGKGSSKSAAKAVLNYLAMRADDENSVCFPSRESICEYTELNKKTVGTALALLEDLKLIIDTGRRTGLTGQVKVYQVNYKFWYNSAPSQSIEIIKPRKRYALRAPKTEPLPLEQQPQIEDKETLKRCSLTAPKTEPLDCEQDGERVPNLPDKGTEFTPKEYRKRDTEQVINKSLEQITLFGSVCKIYPRKDYFEEAERVFNEINPSVEIAKSMMLAIAIQQKSDQWLKEGGRYIPRLEKWLERREWERQAEPINDKVTSEDIPRWKKQGFTSFEDFDSYCGTCQTLSNLEAEANPTTSQKLIMDQLRDKIAEIKERNPDLNKRNAA